MGSGLKHSRCDANSCISDSEYINWGSITPFSAFPRNGKESLYSHKLNCATVCQTMDSCLYHALIGCTDCRLSNHWLLILDNIWMYTFQYLGGNFLCSLTLRGTVRVYSVITPLTAPHISHRVLCFIKMFFSVFLYVPWTVPHSRSYQTCHRWQKDYQHFLVILSLSTATRWLC